MARGYDGVQLEAPEPTPVEDQRLAASVGDRDDLADHERVIAGGLDPLDVAAQNSSRAGDRQEPLAIALNVHAGERRVEGLVGRMRHSEIAQWKVPRGRLHQAQKIIGEAVARVLS